LGLGPGGTAQLTRIGEGWDNAAWSVTDARCNPPNQLVFRLPRRKLGAALLATEAQALPTLAAHLPVPITAPTHHTPALAEADAIDDYPYPVAGYPYLQGTPLDAANLPPDQRHPLATDLGRALRILHAFDPQQAEALGVPGDHLNRADLAWQADKVRARADELTEVGHQTQAQALRAALDLAEADLIRHPEPAGPAQVQHGDLYARHLLIHPADQTPADQTPADQTPADQTPASQVQAPRGLAGIIDWGDLHRGDKAVDLAVAEAIFDPQGRALFEAAYGPITPGTRARARLLGLRSLSALLLYAQAIEDTVMWAEAIQGLDLWQQNADL
jgi:aminoglycoside phosphotransferase (APT) family kinase protein